MLSRAPHSMVRSCDSFSSDFHGDCRFALAAYEHCQAAYGVWQMEWAVANKQGEGHRRLKTAAAGKENVMSEHFFDLLLRRASATNSRRGIVTVLAALTLGGIGSALHCVIDAEANNNHKQKKRRRKKRRKNNTATSPAPPSLACTV